MTNSDSDNEPQTPISMEALESDGSQIDENELLQQLIIDEGWEDYE